MNPIVSFIIPVYNVEKYLEQCLDSAINQSLSNIEIICVDDGSTDSSYEILQDYANSDSRIKVIKQKNSGQGKARNVALDVAKGEYILFLDSDDWIDLSAAEELYNLAKIDDLDVLIFHAINYDDELDCFFETKYYNNAWFPNYFDDKIFTFEDIHDYAFSMSCTPYSKLYKREFIEKNSIRFPLGLFFEDYPFHCEVLLTSTKTKILRKNYYFRRRRKDSVTAEADEKYFDTVEISNCVTNVFKKHGMYEKYIGLLLNRKMEYLMYCYDVIGEKYKDEYLNLVFDDLNTFKEDFIKDNEFLTHLNGIYKYFYSILGKKYHWKELNFLLSAYELNNSSDIKIPFIKDINVAVLLDPLSFNSYSSEFNAFPIEPDNWLEIFENNSIDIFFCESAFDGVGKDYIENGIAIENKYSPWRGDKLIYCNRDKEHTIDNIIDYCKKHNIPTIFWNKENPHAFDEFIDVALKFDYIFTTDEDSIIKYNARGHNNVYQLLFASQIKLYNPIEYSSRSDDIIFAGSWYSWFTERCNMMHDLFKKILESNHCLKIYNRHSIRAEKMSAWQFPEEYIKYVNPGVSSDKMADVYKESKFALNINSITNSPTMFARRVFELMSSNTFIISNYSDGVYNLFGDNVIYLDKLDSFNIDYNKINEICEENLYNVLENHTYYNRFKYILNTINFPFYEKKFKLSFIYFLNKYDSINDIMDDFNSFNYFYKECFVVVEDFDLIKNDHQNVNFISFQELINLNDYWDDNDFFIFRDCKNSLEKNFIKKAFLHYQYLEKEKGIFQSSSKKYVLSEAKDYKDIIFNSINFDKILNNISNITKDKLIVYSI